MSATSAIEWTDATWNPVRGCTRISAGCGGPNRQGGCYAEQIAARFSGPGQPFAGFAERTSQGGRWTGRMALVDEALTLPLRWKKPRRIFVNSMSDLFHENLPDEAIDKVFAVMALAPRHTFQVLTKRAKRMREYFAAPNREGILNGSIWSLLGTPRGSKIKHGGKWRAALPLPNVWLGVSTEDQATADERIPHLLAAPAAKRFISAEPMLGGINLKRIQVAGHGWQDVLEGWRDCEDYPGREERLDWVIAGGESGPRARPAHPDWFRALRDQCAAAGVPYFMKQWGEWEPRSEWSGHLGGGRFETMFAIMPDGSQCPADVVPQDVGAHRMALVGKKAAGAMLDGRMHREFPT